MGELENSGELGPPPAGWAGQIEAGCCYLLHLLPQLGDAHTARLPLVLPSCLLLLPQVMTWPLPRRLLLPPLPAEPCTRKAPLPCPAASCLSLRSMTWQYPQGMWPLYGTRPLTSPPHTPWATASTTCQVRLAGGLCRAVATGVWLCAASGQVHMQRDTSGG